MTPEQEQMLSASSDAYPAGAWCELANDLSAELDDTIYEAAVLIGEAEQRPLWGSLQGSWSPRAREWYAKFDVPGVMGRRAAGRAVAQPGEELAVDEPGENPAYGPGNPDWERDFEKTRECP